MGNTPSRVGETRQTHWHGQQPVSSSGQPAPRRVPASTSDASANLLTRAPATATGARPLQELPTLAQLFEKTATAVSRKQYVLSAGPDAKVGAGNGSFDVVPARLVGAQDGPPLLAKRFKDAADAEQEFNVHRAMAEHPLGESPSLVKAVDLVTPGQGLSAVVMERFEENGDAWIDRVLGDPAKTTQDKADEMTAAVIACNVALDAMHARGWAHNATDNVANFFRQGDRIAIGNYGSARRLAPGEGGTRQIKSDLEGLQVLMRRLDERLVTHGIALQQRI